MSQYWWAVPGGKPSAPMTRAALEQGVASGQIPPNALVCPIGGSSWSSIADVVPSAGAQAFGASSAPQGVSAAPADFAAYVPSNCVGGNWFLLPIAGVVVAFLIGGLYGWLNYYNPVFGVVTALIALAAGWAVGEAIAVMVRFASFRHPSRAMLIGVGCGIVLWYFAWVSFLSVLFWARDVGGLVETWFDLAFSPYTVFRHATRGVLPNGWFRVGPVTFSGIFLLFGWLAEACCFLLLCGFVPYKAAKRPFCERSGRWFREESMSRPVVLPGTDAATVGQVDPRSLHDLVPGDPALPHLTVQLHSLSDDPRSVLVSVHRVVPRTEKDGTIKNQSTEVLSPHFIPPHLAARIRSMIA
jgi:hypothetical protein